MSDGSAPVIGERFGRYLVLDSLSPARPPGWAPRTYHALDLGSRREVALRTMRVDQDRFNDFLVGYEHIRRQVGRGSLLPIMYAAGQEEDLTFLVTQRIPGVSLAELSAAGVVPPTVATQVLWFLALALSQLHGSGLVHGNVHPGNVRVSPDGRLYLVGHVPQPFDRPSAAQLPEHPARRYAPPEFYASWTPSSAGDVYALGLIALELFAGAEVIPMVTARSAPEVLATLPGDLARRLGPTGLVPRALWPLLRSMIAPNPAARPSSGNALLRAIQTALPPEWKKGQLQQWLTRLGPVAASRRRAAALRGTRSALALGNPLMAAARLLRTMGATPGDGEECQDLVMEVFWSTFAEIGGPGSLDRARTEAICFLLLQACEQAENQLLSTLLRRRLGQVADPDGTYGPLLSRPPKNPAREAERRQGILELLQDSPTSEVGLLGLAVTTPDFGLLEGRSLHASKAELLETSGLPVAALVHAARDLAAHPSDPAILRHLAELASRTAGIERPAPPSRPRLPPPETPVPEEPEEDLATRRMEEHFQGDPVGAKPLDADALESAEVDFLEGQVLVKENKLAEAAEVFHRLLEQGVLHEEQYYTAICAELRTLMWKGLLPPEEPGHRLRALRKIWELTHYLRLKALMPLADSLLLSALPEAHRLEQLEEVLGLSPNSLTLRQAAAYEARLLGSERSWAEHLVEAGFLCLKRWDLAAASRLFLAAKTVLGPGRCDEGMKEVMRVGKEVARASLEFRDIREKVLARALPDEAFDFVHGFLKEFPYFRPAMEKLVELAEASDRPLPAALMHMRLARDALLRESYTEARDHLRDILEVEHDNDEALLYLASLEPPGMTAPRDVASLRVWLLRREGLVEAAMYHARRELQGGQEDVPFHEQLVELCRKADEDPSPHRIALGMLAMEREDLKEAHDQFQHALEESKDIATTVTRMLGTPGVWKVIQPGELDAALGEGD